MSPAPTKQPFLGLARRTRAALPLLVVSARLLLAGVLAAAGLAKAVDLPSSVRAVRAYRLLPEGIVEVVAHGLPFLEIGVAVLLLLGVATRLAAIVTAVLLLAFTAGIASAAARGLTIDCGCFGGGGEVGDTHYASEIARDVALLGLACLVALAAPGRLALDHRLARPEALPVMPSRTRSARSAREKAAAERVRRANARATRRRRATAAAAALALVGIAATGALVGRTTVPAAPVAVPAGTTAAGGVMVGNPSAAVQLVIYEDPQCPVCGRFEAELGPMLREAVTAGRVSVEYRLRSFLGPESVRAVAALGAAQAVGAFEPLREQVFAHQPPERTGGFTTTDLQKLGRAAGITDPAFAAAVDAGTYLGWARAIDDRASQDGNVGTPQVLRDGRPVDPAALPGLLAAQAGAAPEVPTAG